MNRIPERNRPLVVLATAAVVLLVVAGGVLLVGRLGPSPTPAASSSPSVASPSANASTPEGAVRAFFEAFGRASLTDDPSLVLPYVTSESAPAYLSARGFLEGQKGLGRGAVVTQQRFENVSVEQDGSTATVTFTYVEGGYLIDLYTGEPLGSPSTLPPARIVAEVRLEGTEWLVHEYESFL